MKKVLLSLAAVSAIAVAAPAAAQPVVYTRIAVQTDARAINQHQADLVQRINRAYQNGRITRAEANRLMAEMRRIDALERHYRRGGLTRWERNQLDARLDRVQVLLRQERRDDDRRYGAGYGRW